MLNTYSFYVLKSTKLFIGLGVCFILCQVACQVSLPESSQSTQPNIAELSSQSTSIRTADHKGLPQEFTYHKSPVTALSQSEDHYIFGHGNGAISIWHSSLHEHSQAILNYLAHEQSIRMIEMTTQKSFRSLSSDGSWAEWDLQGRVIKRGRLKDHSPNVMLTSSQGMAKGFSFFGDAKGTITAMKHKQRIWRTAGEHGRAVFGLANYDLERLISVGSDGWARCWFNQTGEACGEVTLHKGWITHLSQFKGYWLTGGSDGYIKIWPSKLFESSQRQQAKVVQANPQYQAHAQLQAHPKNITHITHGYDFILSGDDLGHVCLSRWDEDNRSLKGVWHIELPNLAPIKALMIDMNQQRILIGGGTQAQIQSYPLYGLNGQPRDKYEELNPKAKLIIKL